MWLYTKEAVRSDLAVLQNEGRPLWDGETPIVVRAELSLRRQLGQERASN